MEVNVSTNPCKGFWIQTFKLVMTPMLRFRKLLRKTNLRFLKAAAGVFILLSCVLTATGWYWYRMSFLTTQKYKLDAKTNTKGPVKGTPFRHVNLNEVYKDVVTEADDMFGMEEFHEAKMVDTPGCKIPVVLVNYVKYINKNFTKKRVTCGKRAVFLRKHDRNTVQAFVKKSVIENYMRRKGMYYECCYRFILREVASLTGRKQTLLYSNCTRFQNNDKIRLMTDFINIRCFEHAKDNKTYTIYDDIFAFTKKIDLSKRQDEDCKMKYNVLMLGMDSMSLPRAVQTLPRTIEYFRNDFWISYRGYHKVGDGSLQNLVSLLTGKNFSTIAEKCSGNMDRCNDLMIWNEFRKAGYVTAYGDDYLDLPDTFSNEFQEPPTDHYMRPFFLKGEYRRKNSSFLCAGKASSGQQILDYAVDFADTYKWDSFFGVFWINSFSHDARSQPHQADRMLENFFNQLMYTRALRNTFVIFFSDHGIRYGMQRFKMESYYDERMPMFFMWLPPYFKSYHSKKLRAAVLNQYRLITPYDIYSTLLDIKRISTCSNETDAPPEGCPNCHSTYQEISSNRTCEDVSIHPKWCCCHKLYPLPIQDSEGRKSVELVVDHIRAMTSKTKTKQCYSCAVINLRNVIRIHFYYDKDKISLYYVVAFTLTPGNSSYEATILRRYDDAKGVIVGPISSISAYTGLGSCAINARERLFCVCKKNDNC